MMLTHQMLSAYSRFVRSNGVKYNQRGSNDQRTDEDRRVRSIWTEEMKMDGDP